MIKSKTESPTTRLKTVLLKLSEYTIELKNQKGSEMQTSDALSQLHNFTDSPDEKDIIPFKFLATLHTKLYRTFIFSFSGKSLCTQDKDIRHNASQKKMW